MVEKIKLNFLGTGSAIPTARRNHPAVLLRYKAESVLIDCGEGTQRQFRKAHLNPCKITKILISHWHGDHVLGLPGLLQTMMLNGYNRKLEIYGPKGTSAKVRQFFDLLGRKGQDLDVSVKEVSSGKIIDEDDFYVEVAKMDHDTPAVAYSFVVKEKMRLDKAKLKKLKVPNSPLVGELVKGKTVEIGGKKINGKKLMYKEDSRKVVVVMDTRYNENAVKLAKGADLLISEATFSKDEQEIADEYGHLTSVGAAKIAKKARVKGLVLMHLSQRYEAIPKVILKEAKEVFKDVRIVEDLDCVEL
jgi:ribonuclease Z